MPITTNPSSTSDYTVPGVKIEDGHRVGEILQLRLHALNDLQLTLKHAHWNVIGPDFIGVHKMLDPQIDAVRGMIDETAERIATLGVSPIGTPGALVSARTWDDYSIGLADTSEHLGTLDVVYDGIIDACRMAIDEVGQIDPITEDMLIEHTKQLEHFQWFVRAHLQDSAGSLATQGAHMEADAADAASSPKQA